MVEIAKASEVLSAKLTVCVGASTAVPAAPVNVSVTQLRAHSAMVTWSVPQGDAVIGYAVSQQVRGRRLETPRAAAAAVLTPCSCFYPLLPPGV